LIFIKIYYDENDKALKEEIVVDTRRWKDTHIHELAELILLK
jgi:hypothetical protein